MGFDLSSILRPIVDFGGNLFNTYNQDRTGGGVADILRQKEISDYEYTKQYNDAAQAYNAQAMAAANSARAASAAASAENERRALAQGKKAQQGLDRSYRQTMQMYAPFRDSATQLLPRMQSTYTQGLDLSNILTNYLQKPENMALLAPSVPAANVPLKLPDYMRR